MTVNIAKFQAALKRVLEHTSRETPIVINDAARDIIIKAAELTHKADAGKIERELSSGTITRTHSKTGKTLKKPKLVAYKPARLVYLIINAKRTKAGQSGLNNTDMSKEAQKFIRRRKSAVGFTAYAGWQKALQAVGGRGFGAKNQQPGFESSSAKGGHGIKATQGNLVAKMINTASAIELYGRNALQEAIDNKTRSMLEHLEQKLQKSFKESG